MKCDNHNQKFYGWLPDLKALGVVALWWLYFGVLWAVAHFTSAQGFFAVIVGCGSAAIFFVYRHLFRREEKDKARTS